MRLYGQESVGFAGSGVLGVSGCLSGRQQPTLQCSALWPQASLSSTTAHMHRISWYSRQPATAQCKGFLSVASALAPHPLRQQALAEASCGEGCGQVFTCLLQGPGVLRCGSARLQVAHVQQSLMPLQRPGRGRKACAQLLLCLVHAGSPPR